MVIPACLEQIKSYVHRYKSKISASPKVGSDGRDDLSISCAWNHSASSNRALKSRCNSEIKSSSTSRSNSMVRSNGAKTRSNSMIKNASKSRSNSMTENEAISRSHSAILDNQANIYEEIQKDRRLNSSRTSSAATSDRSSVRSERSALNRTGPFSGSRPIPHDCPGSKVAKNRVESHQASVSRHPSESSQASESFQASEASHLSESSSKPKCIHQQNPECLNLSHLYLEDGSCLVCNALTRGARKYDGNSFRTADVVANGSVTKQQADSSTKTDEPKRTLSDELNKLTRTGWYWGRLSRFEAEEKLIDKPPGTFLIRDSFDSNYILSLSFRIAEGVFHTRIEYRAGLFHFYLHPNKTYTTVASLVDDLILNSQTGIYYYVRSRKSKEEIRFTIKLDQPLSRFSELKSLKHLCRFIVRETIRFDQIQQLPLPDAMKSYLEANHL